MGLVLGEEVTQSKRDVGMQRCVCEWKERSRGADVSACAVFVFFLLSEQRMSTGVGEVASLPVVEGLIKLLWLGRR
jgi:hypothetical protein